MRVFVLEDDPMRIAQFREASIRHDLTIVTGLCGPDGAFAQWHPPYDLVFLDHDLGGQQMVNSDEEETGAAFTRWLPIAGEHQPLIMIHSFNPVGAQRMAQTLRDKEYTRVGVWPFGSSLLKTLQPSVEWA